MCLGSLFHSDKGILFGSESTTGVKEGATTAMNYEDAPGSAENDAEAVAKIG